LPINGAAARVGIAKLYAAIAAAPPRSPRREKAVMESSPAIGAAVPRAVDGYDPVISGQVFHHSIFKIFDTPGISVQQHNSLACAALDILYFEVSDCDHPRFLRREIVRVVP